MFTSLTNQGPHNGSSHRTRIFPETILWHIFVLKYVNRTCRNLGCILFIVLSLGHQFWSCDSLKMVFSFRYILWCLIVFQTLVISLLVATLERLFKSNVFAFHFFQRSMLFGVWITYFAHVHLYIRLLVQKGFTYIFCLYMKDARDLVL